MSVKDATTRIKDLEILTNILNAYNALLDFCSRFLGYNVTSSQLTSSDPSQCEFCVLVNTLVGSSGTATWLSTDMRKVFKNLDNFIEVFERSYGRSKSNLRKTLDQFAVLCALIFEERSTQFLYQSVRNSTAYDELYKLIQQTIQIGNTSREGIFKLWSALREVSPIDADLDREEREYLPDEMWSSVEEETKAGEAVDTLLREIAHLISYNLEDLKIYAKARGSDTLRFPPKEIFNSYNPEILKTEIKEFFTKLLAYENQLGIMKKWQKTEDNGVHSIIDSTTNDYITARNVTFRLAADLGPLRERRDTIAGLIREYKTQSVSKLRLAEDLFEENKFNDDVSLIKNFVRNLKGNMKTFQKTMEQNQGQILGKYSSLLKQMENLRLYHQESLSPGTLIVFKDSNGTDQEQSQAELIAEIQRIIDQIIRDLEEQRIAFEDRLDALSKNLTDKMYVGKKYMQNYLEQSKVQESFVL